MNKPATPLSLRAMPVLFMPKVLAIGCSTGGPQAVVSLLRELDKRLLHIPIFITQHMPPTLTTLFADNLRKVSNRPCAEAIEGEIVKPGHIYLAPGDFHMICEKKDKDIILHLTKSPPENFCRPAVDPMLRSMAPIYGKQLLTLILTGMGKDGLEGAKDVCNHGGVVIAQDEATSVVWGMPGAVATEGLCSAVLPLGNIVSHISRMFGE